MSGRWQAMLIMEIGPCTKMCCHCCFPWFKCWLICVYHQIVHLTGIQPYLKYFIIFLDYLDTWRCRHLCDGWRAMLAHSSRLTARLAHSQAGRPVHSLTSPTQLFRGRPLGRFPFTLPSIDVVRRLFLLFTWPKYLSFLYDLNNHRNFSSNDQI